MEQHTGYTSKKMDWKQAIIWMGLMGFIYIIMKNNPEHPISKALEKTTEAIKEMWKKIMGNE